MSFSLTAFSAIPQSCLWKLQPLPNWLPVPQPRSRQWSRAQLAGRLCELSSPNGAAVLTTALRLVLDTQLEDDPVAWITATPNIFFAPDVAENGVDLNALVVVRVPRTQAATRVADRLLRSGAFGLIVMDLDCNPVIPIPLQARLVKLAHTHDTALLCLTSKEKSAPSLGSMVSLRGQAHCRRLSADHFRCEIEILKDKRNGPGWKHIEVFRGPDGLH